MSWFLIPVRTESIDRSIRNQVPLSSLRQLLGDAESERLAALGDGEIRCSVISNGLKAQFVKMAPGDHVLITESGTWQFNYVAQVTAKITNKDLGRYLLPAKPRANAEPSESSPPQLVYFLKNLRSIEVGKEALIVLLDHEPRDFVAAARQLDKKKLARFEAEHGPLLDWLRKNAKLDWPSPAAATKPTIGKDYAPATTTPLTYEVGEPMFTYDAEKVERGRKGHMDTQNALAGFLRERGLEPRSPAANEPDFDLAWMVGETVFVAEVKSTTPHNEEHQLRLGLGQVLRYWHQLITQGKQVVAVLVPEHAPSDPRWIELCRLVEVRMGWPGAFEGVLDPAPGGVGVPEE